MNENEIVVANVVNELVAENESRNQVINEEDVIINVGLKPHELSALKIFTKEHIETGHDMLRELYKTDEERIFTYALETLARITGQEELLIPYRNVR